LVENTYQLVECSSHSCLPSMNISSLGDVVRVDESGDPRGAKTDVNLSEFNTVQFKVGVDVGTIVGQRPGLVLMEGTSINGC